MAEPSHILITGASDGIGAALAREYAAAGFRLSLTGRDRQRLDDVADACRGRGAEVEIHVQDVRDGEALARWIADADGRRPLDAVYANAGITGGVSQDGAPEDWNHMQQLIDVNLTAALRTAQSAISCMLPRGRGRVVLISSLQGLRGLPSSPTYSAAKAGLLAWGDAMRGLMAGRGIRIQVVCPGYVDTGLSRQWGGNKPFVMAVDKAARLIRQRVENDQAIIAFPWILALGLRLTHWLPVPIADFFLRRFVVYRRGGGGEGG